MPKRKVLQNIKINNGNLTYEIDPTSSNWRRDGSWYRNGKKFTPYGLSKYSFVDNGVTKILKPNGEIDAKYSAQLEKKNMDYYKTKQLPRQTNAYTNIKKSDKYITLNIPNSSMHGAMIPTNMLDSIIISSGRSHTPIKQNLGLVGKESTFLSEFRHPIGDYFDKHNIVNNHVYVDLNPYFKYIENVYKNFKDIKKREADIKYALSHENDIIFKNVNKIYDENDPLADAFLRYNAAPNKYNSGQDNYQQMVNIIGDKVYNEPQVAAYLNSKHAQEVYKKGVNERKRKTLSGDY